MNLKAQWLYNLEEVRRNNLFGPMQMKRDIYNRLHCETGPAFITPTVVCHYIEGRRHGVYADIWGTEMYYFRNILIPKKYATHPETLTVEGILTHPNTEVRYAGLEIYGYDRMEQEGSFKVLHIDKKKGSKLLQFSSKTLEVPITVVKVINSTPEPDGTRKPYFLRVPPEMKTCAEAVAWTFRKDEQRYNPDIET